MFIGEAPGRLGADSSQLPFHGDKAGENFETLLERVGLSRHESFVTNAVLCNPKDEQGNNATPTKKEVENCSAYLKQQIDLVDPQVVVTLGAQALAALTLIAPHEITLSEGVRSAHRWCGRILVPLYHPGQRAMVHRSFLNQLADYQFLSELVKRVGRVPRPGQPRPTSEVVASVARTLLQQTGPVSYFALHKLYYLVEYEYARRYGQRLTQCYVVRQKDGPYVVELNIKRLKKALPELQLRDERGKLIVTVEDEGLFSGRTDIAADVAGAIEYVVSHNAGRTDADLKRVVYLTAPMRRLLRAEKYRGSNMFNAPIRFVEPAAA